MSGFRIAAGLAMMAAAGCANGDGKSIATFEHDLNGKRTLYAYAPEPAAENRQEDKVHKQLYGPFGDTKSPRTPYICVWRDPGSGRDRKARPAKIFLTCVFGSTDWEPPAKLIEQAEARMKREEAVIGIQWDRDGDAYRLTRFEAQVRDLPANVNFRSANFSPEEIAASRIEASAMKFPATLNDPFEFQITATAPYRLNRGEPAKAPDARLTIRGTAVPIPPWVMY